jgi:hypothetical protein
MNQRRYILALGLIAALTNGAPVMAADVRIATARTPSQSESVGPENTHPLTLGEDQLDQVTAGADDLNVLIHACKGGACFAFLSDGRYIAWYDIWGNNYFVDTGGTVYGDNSPGSK